MIYKNTIIRRTLQPLWSSLDRVVRPYISKGLVVAVSGGADSRALLESLALWPQRRAGRIIIACFDHQQRLQSKRESKLVAMRAQVLGFTVHHESFNIGLKGEKELRVLRYQALQKLAAFFACKSIVTAHHMDDNAEGFLMAMFGYGGGSLGAAMAASDNLNDYFLLRPFLNLSKNQLLLALTMLGYTDYALDNLDQDRKGQRAYVRHEIMPGLSGHFPAINIRLDLLARSQFEHNLVLHTHAGELINWLGDSAEIELFNNSDRLSLSLAIRQALTRLCPDKDFRQSRPTLEKILNHYWGEPGLNQTLKRVTPRSSRTKKYYFPGALVEASGTKIIIRRLFPQKGRAS